jgi:hypothetical protein
MNCYFFVWMDRQFIITDHSKLCAPETLYEMHQDSVPSASII